MRSYTFIDLFAGIGGMRLAFERSGFECLFSSEWNKFAQQTYSANFGDTPHGDITEIESEDIPDHDVLVAGFPCQPFSLAGVSKKESMGRPHGFEDPTQGTLFFDVSRIIRDKRPKAFLLENVKNLTSHDKGRTFSIIRETLEALDYSISFKVIDAKGFAPQHRERIFIVGFDKKEYPSFSSFNFQSIEDARQNNYAISSILIEDVPDKYTLSDNLWAYLRKHAEKHAQKGNGFGYGLMNDLSKSSRTLSARYYKDGSEILIPTSTNPRRLTPREAARLQGFPDDFVIPVSDNQAYKQFGNSICVPLVQTIANELKNTLAHHENGGDIKNT